MSNNYKIPYLECPNLIINSEGIYGLKDLDLLRDHLKEYNIFTTNEYNKINKDESILWFDKKYNNIIPLNNKINNKFSEPESNLLTRVSYLIQDITKLIYSLENKGKTLVSINLNDIIVINNFFFIFINQFKVCNLCAERNLALTYMPIPLSDYIAPEIICQKLILPLKFHKKSCYWSLGALALDILFECKIDINVDRNHIIKVMRTIRFNPIYNFILRCIEKEADNRRLVMI